ncbi:serine/threonine protein kinase, partial [Streptomyces varsoviensis]
TAPPTPPPPPPLQSRTGKALKWSVSALLIAALGLGSWQLADTLLKDEHDKDNPPSSQSGHSNTDKKPVIKPLPISGATEFSPLDGPTGKNPQNAVDGDPGTAWITGQFFGWAEFGNRSNRKDGSGIVVDLGSVKNVSDVHVDMYRPGQTTEILAADPSASGNPSTLSDFPQRVSKSEKAGSSMDTKLKKPVRTRYLLIHVTALPPDGTGSGTQTGYRGGIAEIKVKGS